MIVKTKKGDLPVRFGMNALAEFGDLTGKNMNEALKCLGGSLYDLKVSELIAFIYAGFKIGALWKGEECQIKSKEEIGFMLDDEPDIINQVFAIYNDGAEENSGDKKK